MIKIVVYEHNDHFVSLEMKGHANAAPKGEDLVCSAVSAIILGGLNSLTDGGDHYETSVEEGHVSLKALKPLADHDEIALKTIVTQLESVAVSYPHNAKLERKKA
jgi:uncharacterized protein